MDTLQGKKVLMFLEDHYEDLELWYPKIRLMEEGADVITAGPEEGKTYRGKNGYPCTADRAVKDIQAHDFDILVISGGYAPDRVRRIPEALKITKQMFDQGKVIAFICHAGWVPVSAGILNGATCTSFYAIKDDLVNAGAKWEDKAVVVDRNLISSRTPDDLPDFCKAIIQAAAGS